MNRTVRKLIPVMFAFFAMGAVDFVGIATNYVKADFALSDTLANFFTSMVFFWFLIFAVPTGLLMNKIGRKKTVIVSLWVTALALAIPLIDYNLVVIMISFSLLGIGNTIMQVSVNPLLSNIVSGKNLSGALTFGQFVKSCASFIAPILAGWSVIHFNSWQILFPFFLIICILSIAMLSREKIQEEEIGQVSTFKECFSLLGRLTVFLYFVGIICHVGIDVGINVSIPKLIMQKLNVPLTEAGYATSIYFLFRTIGSFSGAWILPRFSAHHFFIASITLMLIAMGGLFLFDEKIPLYICLAFIGYGNANMFPIIFAQALHDMHGKKNEISGLMIMGIFGGTIFPLVMGIVTDITSNQLGSIAVMIFAAVYLLVLSRKIKN